ncbi:MAG: hypothetical protein WC780_03870 [Lentimicrobiaceae bacterium]|jgi:hypothetical protein
MNAVSSITLFLHSWNRWLILIAGILVIAAAVKGLSSKSVYSPFQKRWSLIFLSSLHLQLLVGLMLYFFLSPITAQAFTNFGAAMKEPVLRFWVVEHAFVNVIAIAIAQTGSILVKRQADSAGKHKRTLVWTGIAMLLILLMVPMGMMGVERPWFRF